MRDEVLRAAKDEHAAHHVATAWRPIYQRIVRAFLRDDYILSSPIAHVRPLTPETANHLRDTVKSYGATLSELHDETWKTSIAQWMGSHWETLIDLSTLEEGRSDLVLHTRVFEKDGSFEIAIDSIHVP